MEEGTATARGEGAPQAKPRRDPFHAGLGSEAVNLLQTLIRVDTVNPPGNERALQEELKGLLELAGYECELLAAEPERPNLVARLRGNADGPTLTLLGHVDTVRADREEWSRDPWGGELIDGWVWGRGALDMKGQVAAELAACLELGRSGWRPPAGELLLVLTVDEEAGGGLGAQWLCEQHPDKVRSDLVVNEGGGAAIEIGGRRLYTLSVGEKGIFRVRLRTGGVAGHASLPRIGDNALLKLGPLLTRLRDQPPPEPTPIGLAFLSAVLGDSVEDADGMERALARLRAEQPLLVDFIAEPMLGVTLTPTRAEAGKKANVIPSEAEMLIDCRVPPGLDAGEAAERIKALLGEGDYELDFSEAVIGNSSSPDTPLAAAIRVWLEEADPGAELVPIVMPGFSDSNWFRTAFDAAVVYGFCPLREIDLFRAAPLIHGADERVPAADVELAAGFFYELPRRVLA
jgi:acetylornithine deacetylase/succinyl-diaminopimelate desuccinylase-like protein